MEKINWENANKKKNQIKEKVFKKKKKKNQQNDEQIYQIF